MKVKINEKDGKLYVNISILEYNISRRRSKIVLRDVIQLLKERNIKHGKCLKSHKVTNRTDQTLSGLFVFELPAPAPEKKITPKKKPSTSRRRPSSKSSTKKNKEIT